MKKVIFSGVQPSGDLHLGNYLGALKQWVDLQNQYNCIFCVVDYHAITVKQDPVKLKKKIIEIAKIYLAAGINPAKVTIFQQSQVSEHTELAWILNTIAKVSELQRMTQFKDKSKQNKNSINMGLFGYPVLMAADILLYNTDLVPVGDDQEQHVELARTLARRFDTVFGHAFKIPEVLINKQGARIMGLDDPKKKMSKSANPANYIALLDKPATAKKKIMRAVTDSGQEIKFNPQKKPAISNLMNIYSLLSGIEIKDIEEQYQGKGYGDFKKDLAELVVEFLENFQSKYYTFEDSFIMDNILAKGNKQAKKIAEQKLAEAKKLVGVL